MLTQLREGISNLVKVVILLILVGGIHKSNPLDNTNFSLSDMMYEEKLDICSFDVIQELNFFLINKF